MKRLLCLMAVSAMLCACLPAAAAEEELKDVRCDEWHFSIRIPGKVHAYPVSVEDLNTDSVIAGGLNLTAGAEDDLPGIRVIRRSRIYDAETYLGISFQAYLDQYGENEQGECTVYSFGGRTLYGNTGIVYGEQEEELFREIRLIPVSDDRGTEFAARYTAETEAEVFLLLDTVIRYYRPDEEPEKAEADFLPAGHSGEPDLENGEFLRKPIFFPRAIPVNRTWRTANSCSGRRMPTKSNQTDISQPSCTCRITIHPTMSVRCGPGTRS